MRDPHIVQRHEIIEIPWTTDAGKKVCYSFHCTDAPRSWWNENHQKTHFKAVYKGYFLRKAPGHLKPGVLYYLKHIHALPNSAKDYLKISQTRERNELLPLKGPHLRTLLAINPDAVAARDSLMETFDCSENQNCYIVEQPYQELPHSHSHIEELTVHERLSYLEQVCIALAELYKWEVAGHRIIAHRDVKLSNCLIERERNRFTVRLTDFATVKFADDAFADDYQNPSFPNYIEGSGDNKPVQTAAYLMSPENTAPESLDPSLPVDGSVDVYALGSMLASLFGYIDQDDTVRNPNKWFCAINDWNNSQLLGRTALSDAFKEAADLDSRLDWDTHQTSWLEEALEGAFHWGDHPNSPNQPSPQVLKMIRNLFFRATRAHPHNRCTLDEFRQELVTIRSHCVRQFSTSSLLYDIPETVCLFHQQDLHRTRSSLKQAAEVLRSANSDHVSIRRIWYFNPEDSQAANAIKKSGMHFSRFSTLQNEITGYPVATPANAASVCHALDSIYRYYYRNRHEVSFTGDIHIFTCQEITPAHLSGILHNNQSISIEKIHSHLCRLFNLKGDYVNIYLHTPEEPQFPPDISDLFFYEQMPSPYRAAPAYPPEADTFDDEDEENEAYGTGDTGTPPEELYLTGSEALFFLHGEENEKIFVSRRKV